VGDTAGDADASMEEGAASRGGAKDSIYYPLIVVEHSGAGFV